MPKTEPMEITENPETQDRVPQIRVSTFATQSSNAANLVSVMNQLHQKQNDANETCTDEVPEPETIPVWVKHDNGTTAQVFISTKNDESTSNQSTPSSGIHQKSIRRRVRRKHNSPDDKAEALTEMSVRGLNLFRYASIQDGVYQCTECAKENVQKTFKNKYSFQRHAFLYHEGTQRKVFPCPVCRKEFSRPDKMKNHMKMTHENLAYMPKDCNFPLLMTSGTASSQSASINNNIVNIATSQ